MKNHSGQRAGISIAVAAAFFAAAVPSFAAPILRVTSGADTLTLKDDLAGAMIPLSDVVRLSVDDWRLHGNSHSPDSAAGAIMNLNSVSVTTSKAASLTLELTETGFTNASDVANFVSQISGVINRKDGSGLEYAVYADAGNAAFGKQSQFAFSAFGPGAFSHAGIMPAALDFSMPYSITIVASLTHGGAGTSKFGSMVRIPEPASAVLLGAGLLMFAVMRGRRRAPPTDATAAASRT